MKVKYWFFFLKLNVDLGSANRGLNLVEGASITKWVNAKDVVSLSLFTITVIKRAYFLCLRFTKFFGFAQVIRIICFITWAATNSEMLDWY